MIRVFGQTDTSFLSNGDIVISPLKAKVHKQDNGDYYLDLETGLEYVDYFTEGRIIVANTPTGDQAFRIGNVTKTKSKLSSRCYHVFYDSKNYLIAGEVVTDKNCNDAIAQLNASTEPQSEFLTLSDIQTIKSYSCVRKSLYEVINDVLSIWGGHLVRDNFNIAVKSAIGQDNGIIVQYKKNLKEITVKENWDSVVTKILPVGKDETLLNAVDPTASIYLTSSTQYSLPYTKTVTFQQDIDERDFETEEAYKSALVADLTAQATAYLEENSLPKVNYTLRANLDVLTDIGDTIEVIDERLDVHLMTTVISFTYDCISEKYTEVEFGNFTDTINGLVGNITASASKIATEKAQESTDEVINMMTNSYVVYDGTQILVLDSLPKETAENVIKINSQGIGFSQNGVSGAITSKWGIDGALNLGGKDLEDFITDEGVTSGWNWRKYSSGIIEAWGQIEVNSTSVTWSTLITGLSKGTFSVLHPFDIADPVVVATMKSCDGTGWIAGADGGQSSSSITAVRSAATGTMVINIHILGEEPS